WSTSPRRCARGSPRPTSRCTALRTRSSGRVTSTPRATRWSRASSPMSSGPLDDLLDRDLPGLPGDPARRGRARAQRDPAPRPDLRRQLRVLRLVGLAVLLLSHHGVDDRLPARARDPARRDPAREAALAPAL